MKIILSTLLITIGVQNGFAQKFWLTTYEFPGGPKTGITLANDSCLFVGLQNGIIRSCNEGNDFDSVLNASVIFSVFASHSGKVFAGGSGKIFRTSDLGQSWDSVALNTTYSVTQIIENQQEDLFAISGTLDNNLGFVGGGVYFSDDGGMSWTQRNNGLGLYTSMERISIDKNGRLYVTTADEYVTGNGGLFISDNNGLLWEHINITIDGKGAINNAIKVANTWGLSVSPDDSVYFSFAGTAVNVGVQLNACKSINDIRTNNFWKTYNLGVSSTWWMDKILNNIHFAQNEDWYCSAAGSINTSGTFFSKDQGANWQRIDYGLGLDIFNERNIQYFSETSAGKIFMVQLLDERVYWADTSVLTAIESIRANPAAEIFISPNPVQRGETFLIQFTIENEPLAISIYDISGKEVLQKVVERKQIFINAPSATGLYFITVGNSSSRQVTPLLVR